ncbi:MAG: FAD:protein FMN transferase [Deferribacteraceae bacterium]|nr:FAD:protein FMN transferase [Deferribacteraceae bacterium]
MLLTLVACGQRRDRYETKIFFAMGTVVEITIPEKNRDILPEAEKRLNGLAEIISSDCFKISSSPDLTEINELTYRLFQRENDYRLISENHFNSAVLTVSALYGFPEGPFAVPANDKLEEAKMLFRSNNINIFTDNKTGKHYAKGNGLKIDLGAFAKGWIVDNISTYLKSNGINNFIVNAGGDLFAGGEKERDKAWHIGIKDPDNKKPYITVARLSGKALATSGVYERYFINENGERISHIFDGINGEPVNNYKSLSVIADTAELADAFSTIYFLMPAEDIDRLCVLNNTAVFRVTPDGIQHRHCGWEKYETGIQE